MGWRDHRWQGWFSSCFMNERYLLEVARYIERNPEVAWMVKAEEDCRWNSAANTLGITLIL